jgi:hypothetical protein
MLTPQLFADADEVDRPANSGLRGGFGGVASMRGLKRAPPGPASRKIASEGCFSTGTTLDGKSYRLNLTPAGALKGSAVQLEVDTQVK